VGRRPFHERRKIMKATLCFSSSHPRDGEYIELEQIPREGERFLLRVDSAEGATVEQPFVGDPEYFIVTNVEWVYATVQGAGRPSFTVMLHLDPDPAFGDEDDAQAESDRDEFLASWLRRQAKEIEESGVQLPGGAATHAAVLRNQADQLDAKWPLLSPEEEADLIAKAKARRESS
jgi:hypothetical protein